MADLIELKDNLRHFARIYGFLAYNDLIDYDYYENNTVTYTQVAVKLESYNDLAYVFGFIYSLNGRSPYNYTEEELVI